MASRDTNERCKEIVRACVPRIYAEHRLGQQRLGLVEDPPWEELGIEAQALWFVAVSNVRKYEKEHQEAFDRYDAMVTELATQIAIDERSKEKP